MDRTIFFSKEIDEISFAHISECVKIPNPQLHGHNAIVRVKLGIQGSNDSTYSFANRFFEKCKELVKQIDHKTIVPRTHIVLHKENLVTLMIGDKRYRLPEEDLVLVNDFAAGLTEIPYLLLDFILDFVDSANYIEFGTLTQMEIECEYGNGFTAKAKKSF